VDGIVLEGTTRVDESMIRGTHARRKKHRGPGDGRTIMDGQCDYDAEAVGRDTLLADRQLVSLAHAAGRRSSAWPMVASYLFPP